MKPVGQEPQTVNMFFFFHMLWTFCPPCPGVGQVSPPSELKVSLTVSASERAGLSHPWCFWSDACRASECGRAGHVPNGGERSV